MVGADAGLRMPVLVTAVLAASAPAPPPRLSAAAAPRSRAFGADSSRVLAVTAVAAAAAVRPRRHRPRRALREAAAAAEQQAGVAERSFYFQAWSDRLEEMLVPALNLQEESLPRHLARRRGRQHHSEDEDPNNLAEISGRIFTGAGAGNKVRRFRVALVQNGPKLQAFNAVLYPSYDLGPLPVLGVDILSFNNHQRLLFGLDWAPMRVENEYVEAHISPHVADVREKYKGLLLEPSNKFYGEAPEFFSPQMFFSRPAGPEALAPGQDLWQVFEEYCLRYCDMLRSADLEPGSRPGSPRQAEERQAAYDTWHAERDPAVPIFRRLFGERWAKEYTKEVLFPGSAEEVH